VPEIYLVTVLCAALA